jgi:hypothetical protein|tara:strand:+ start:92 stop:1108 length:1017 start_codon:yes stop_codon:yes gene_type:complete
MANKISTSSRFNEVAGALATLQGVHTINEIVGAINQIHNFKYEWIDDLTDIQSYDNNPALVDIGKCFVDLDYQRRLRLRKILNNLRTAGAYDKSAAGHVDIAVRLGIPGQPQFVWDGFRRSVMARLCGHEQIPASLIKHSKNYTNKQCQEEEARWFKLRNTPEKMMREEIFKARVVYKEEAALLLLDFLKECNLDVEGLNPTGKTLGGFATFEDNTKNIDDSYRKQASLMIQRVWNQDEFVTVYLIMGLGLLLQVNDSAIKALSDGQIEDVLHNFKGSQKDLTKHSLNSKREESIAYYIAKTLLAEHFNDGGKEFKMLIKELKLEEEDQESIEYGMGL